MAIFGSSRVTAQQPPGVASDPFAAIYEQSAQSIEQWRSAFESHRETPGAADLVQVILEPGQFIDFHAQAVRAWADQLESNSTTNLGDMALLHNGVQGFNTAAWEAVHLMDLMLDSADFGPVDTAQSRARIEELIFACYFSPPGEDVAGCPLRKKTRVTAAYPLTHISAIYDDESELNLEFEVVNDGDSAAQAIFLRTHLDNGLVTSLRPTRGSCEEGGLDWTCDVGDIGVGERVGFDAHVEVGLDLDLPTTELTTGLLSVDITSPVAELDPEFVHGGFEWQATDCDERYRKAVRSFSMAPLDAAQEKAGAAAEGLPGERLYEPDEDQAEVNALVAEIISNGGADDFIVDHADGNFRDEFNGLLRKESSLGACDAPPAGALDRVSLSRTDINDRHREISQLRLRAEDDVRARVRGIQVAMLAASDEMYDGGYDSILNQSEVKASKWYANQLFKLMTMGSPAAVLPAGVGFLSAIVNTAQAIEAGSDLILLAEARLALPETLAALESLAYIEGLEQRYEDLMDAQDHMLEEIRNLHDSECFCE